MNDIRTDGMADAKAMIRKGSVIHEAIVTTRRDEQMDTKDISGFISSFSVYAWVYASIYAISNSAAGIPILLFEKDMEGELQEITDHPILTVLNRPNKFQTRYDLIEMTYTYLESTGNAFWELVRDKFGNVLEIYPLNPKYMSIQPDPKNFIKNYTYEINGKKIVFEPENIIHLKYPDPDNEYWGQSPLAAARDAMIQEKNSIQWNKSFFLNSARPDVVFHVNGPLNKNAFARMKATIKKLYGGVEKAHSAAIIEGGVKVETLGFAQKDVEFLALRKYNRDEILACFGVPPCVVGVFESAIKANAEEQRKFFWETTMVQKLMKIEMALNQLFVPKFSKFMPSKKLVLMFDLSDVEALGEQTETKTNRLNSCVLTGVLSRNEARIELGYEPIEGLDTIYIPLGLQPAGTDGTMPDTIPGTTQLLAVNPNILMTTEKKEVIWKSVDQPRESLITDAEKQYNKYFSRLLDRTIENLENAYNGKLKDFFRKKLNVEAVFAEKKEQELLNKLLAKQLGAALKVSGNIAMIEIAIDIGSSLPNFNDSKPNVEKFIKDSALAHATTITNTTKEKLRRQLELALEKEETLKEITDRVRSVLGVEATKARARLIAENEIGTAYNAARRFATQQIVEENPDVKLFKVWISARDEKVRTTHQLNDDISNSKPLDIDKAYPNGLMFPKDPKGSAEEVINCRCVESYVSGTKLAKLFGKPYRKKMRTVKGVLNAYRYIPMLETSKDRMQKELMKTAITLGRKTS